MLERTRARERMEARTVPMTRDTLTMKKVAFSASSISPQGMVA